MKTEPNTISLYIVDDHRLIIEGLRSSLQHAPGICIVGHALTGKACLDFFKSHTADVVLMDISLPDISGIALCSELLSLNRSIQILGLSTYNQRSYIMELLNNGARGYLLKNTDTEEIKEAIYQVAKGNIFINKEAADTLYQHTATTAEQLPTITRREGEVLKLIVEGLTAPKIAEKLFLSQLTVETHRRNIMLKLKAKNVAKLVKIAVDRNLV